MGEGLKTKPSSNCSNREEHPAPLVERWEELGGRGLSIFPFMLSTSLFPTSSGSCHTFPAPSSHDWLPPAPASPPPDCCSLSRAALHTGFHTPMLVPSCSCLPQIAPWDLGPYCLCILVSSALSTRPHAGRDSIHTLVRAYVFRLYNALISLQKKERFLWSNKFGKCCTRHPSFIDSQCTSASLRFQEVLQ